MATPFEHAARRDDGGHYITAGTAVAFVGLVGILVALYATLTDAPTGFIDRQGMAIFSVLFLAVGGWMRNVGASLAVSKR